MPVHLVMPSAFADGNPRVGRVEVADQVGELLAVLFPHLAGLEVSRIAGAGDTVVAFASVTGAEAPCPGCGFLSSRVPGRCRRLVADGAAGGRPLLIALWVRRFRCTDPSCPKITFVEQAEGLTGRCLRRTLPLREMPARFGLEAGRAGRLPAGRGPGHPGALLHAAAAGHGPARPRRDGGPESHRG